MRNVESHRCCSSAIAWLKWCKDTSSNVDGPEIWPQIWVESWKKRILNFINDRLRFCEGASWISTSLISADIVALILRGNDMSMSRNRIAWYVWSVNIPDQQRRRRSTSISLRLLEWTWQRKAIGEDTKMIVLVQTTQQSHIYQTMYRTLL